MIAEVNIHTAPPIPTNRPPTRAEVWAHVQHFYGNLKTTAELEKMARDRWAGNYIYAVNFNGWRKQPDWTEGDPVIDVGLPEVFEAGSTYRDIRPFLDRVRERREP